MNWWPGSKEDSARQAADRSQRQARRVIQSLQKETIASDEENFEDCDTSFSANLNIDGEPGSAAESRQTSPARQVVRMPDPPVSVIFEDADAEDDSEAWKKEVKIKFNQNDVDYWFNTVEAQMKKFGINKQWSKKDAIVPLLPDEIVEECMPILRLKETEAPNSYKLLKTEILSLYGPKEEDAFKKAMALRLNGKPSALGKKLIHIWCPGAKPFDGCHCAKVVWGFYEAQMTPEIRSHLAGLKFNKDTYSEIFKKSDEVWLANGGTTSATSRNLCLSF